MYNKYILKISIASGCSISVNGDLGSPQPLILVPDGGSGKEAFFYPTVGDVISFTAQQSIDLACPRGTIRLNGISTGNEILRGSCRSGSLFEINNQVVSFPEVTCSSQPFHTARFSGNTCLGIYNEIEVGFIVGDRFLKHLSICFDHIRQTTLYSLFNLTSAIDGFQRGFPRPGWIEGNFFNVGGNSLDALWRRDNQRVTINRLVGLEDSSVKYVVATGNFYLARGHLTAKTDFVFGSQHRLTFHLVNAAPQWQTFNAGNWLSVESNVRSFASTRRLDLIVYTGTHGVSTLPHEVTNEDVELFLYVNGTKRAAPVPQLFWKVVYEPVSEAGIVFIGVNNPYDDNFARNLICMDVSDQVSWLTWSPLNQVRGFSYSCDVNDFRKTVTLPEFNVRELLK